MKTRTGLSRNFVLGLVLAGLGGADSNAWAVGPRPQGTSAVTVSYPTASGDVSYGSNPDFRGAYFPDAQPLGDAPNIKVFQAENAYGRRVNVGGQFPEVIGDDESVVAHAFLKLDNSGDYFPGIPADGTVTVEVRGIHFNGPVRLEESTFLLHTLWDLNQSDALDMYYDHEHNLHTLTDPFRNEHEFEMAHEIVHHPAHHVFGDLADLVTIEGQGTDTLNILAEIPYSMFRHIMEEGQEVPDGLPAPHGFLEPYHFHLEYVVSAVPEPGTLVLLAVVGLAMVRKRR